MGVLGGRASSYERGAPVDVTVMQSTKTPPRGLCHRPPNGHSRGGPVSQTVCKVVLTLEDRVLGRPASGEKVCKGRKAPMASASSLCRALSA